MTIPTETTLAPFEERAEQLLSRVFCGMHHIHSLKKFPNGLYSRWTCIHHGDAATQDFDLMTRLVFAAHEYCCRVTLSNGGPRSMKVTISNRDRSDSYTDGHQTIEQALEKWNSHAR